ncbi:regulator of chromosome condensation 1/beta-lactamase-inhibitor protein II [Pterulicium gracile]|uniref:Regulator of chromosome condensation 1/beta-lactamase-inhibitor protein II n=1 Tax=Pterulicium gracile TaxID=1884261 RepID=A0A5C3QJM9_9AGAR|nr:regulator of chromosome condensation 1/beta-lactamase-inhibitor protein II [Pterula gracilis]
MATPFNALPTAPAAHRPALNLFVWGAGNFGQFGAGPDDLGEKTRPRRNPWVDENIDDGTFGSASGAGIESIAAGGMHTLFIDENGTVWSCGVNDEAALGRPTDNVLDPQDPESVLDVDELSAWPHPIQSLVDAGFRAVRVAAGGSVSAVISSQGELRVWGSFRGDDGALGFSRQNQHQLEPQEILKLPNKDKVTAVAAGSNHVVVLTTSGHVYTWGAGEQYQLGRRIIERRKINGTSPERVVLGIARRRAVGVGAGKYQSFAIDEDGNVWGWGLNALGQTGAGRARATDNEVRTPALVKDLTLEDLNGDRVISIKGGDFHTLFLTRQGRVFACGGKEGSLLGLPSDHPAILEYPDRHFIDTPVLVNFPNDDPIVQISVGQRSNLAVTENGALYSWGQGPQGELGCGELTEVDTPRVIVRGPRGGGAFKAIHASCGGQHTLGLFQQT